ncbi:hypothetical protein [Chitinophaga agrisoli]|uniref:hypothetical protein n=1 Tax=Chitinophaga agrisoli TaxID=2607653 RepID=UPI00122DDEF0|nr:hypothetical protein [Chitinophaga agrisoli]
MKQLLTEGLVPLSQDELSAVQGGGFLTDLTARLVPEVANVIGVVKNVTTTSGTFLSTIVDILV